MSNAVSKAASILGSIKTKKKAAASRKNGKLGGRPPMTELQRYRAKHGFIAGNSAQKRKARRAAKNE